MAFAQLTHRESLRDIEVSLAAHRRKLYHSGFRNPVRRSTLADANETRDWRIYADFAQHLIQQARPLYAGTNLGLELEGALYALDSSVIDLSLTLFPWAPFERSKAGVKLHTLFDVQSAIPVLIDITGARGADSHVLDRIRFEPGSVIVMDRGYIDFPRLWIASLKRWPSLFSAPNGTSSSDAVIPMPSIRRQACAATKPSC